MSDDDDFKVRRKALLASLNDIEEASEEEPYSAPHCSKCHEPLSGVAGKVHSRECPGHDGHMMDQCPHPGTRWRKTHHKKEVKIQKQLKALARDEAKAKAKVILTGSPAFCASPGYYVQFAVENRDGVPGPLAVCAAIFAQ